MILGLCNDDMTVTGYLFFIKTNSYLSDPHSEGYPISMLSLPAGFIYLTSLEV